MMMGYAVFLIAFDRATFLLTNIHRQIPKYPVHSFFSLLLDFSRRFCQDNLPGGDPNKLPDSFYRPSPLTYKGASSSYVDKVIFISRIFPLLLRVLVTLLSSLVLVGVAVSKFFFWYCCEKVLLTSNESDHFVVKILMRSTRRPGGAAFLRCSVVISFSRLFRAWW